MQTYSSSKIADKADNQRATSLKSARSANELMRLDAYRSLWFADT
jgi:hypothetical protein